MFLHISNLFHIAAFVVYLLILGVFARNTRAKIIRTVSSLIQMSVVLLGIDILIGFLAIEPAYGSHLSAGWISKSVFGVPLLTLGSFVWMWVARRNARR